MLSSVLYATISLLSMLLLLVVGVAGLHVAMLDYHVVCPDINGSSAFPNDEEPPLLLVDSLWFGVKST